MKMGKYIYVYVGLLVVGLVGGYIYWNFWGCTDSCPMDSDWRFTMGRGGLIGLCAAAIFHPRKPKVNPGDGFEAESTTEVDPNQASESGTNHNPD